MYKLNRDTFRRTLSLIRITIPPRILMQAVLATCAKPRLLEIGLVKQTRDTRHPEILHLRKNQCCFP